MNERIGCFDALRGIAVLVVVNEHFLKLFFVLAFSDAAMKSESFGLLETLSFPPFNLLHNGAWAVSLFFVLSGYVLSHYFFSREGIDHREISGRIIARYFRLAIPVTASLVLVWVMMGLGLFYFPEVAELTQSKEYNQYLITPTLIDMLKQGFGSALFMGDYAYNPPLWTMSVEMIGSMGIFILQAIFLFFMDSRYAWFIRMAIYVVLIALLFPTMYVGFVLGMLLCDCKNDKSCDDVLSTYAKYWVPVSFVLGIILCAYMIRGLYSNPFSLITFNEFNPYNEYIYNTWGAFFLVTAVVYSKKAARMLANPVLLAMGKISFSLYLIHYTLMSAITAYLYLTLPVDGHVQKAVLAIGLSIPILFITAYIFEMLVNEPAIKISKVVKQLIVARRAIAIKSV